MGNVVSDFLGPQNFQSGNLWFIRWLRKRFLRNEALRICHQGSEIARGIINFSSEELWEAQLKKWKVGFAKKPMGNTAGGFQYVSCSPPIWEMIHFDF